MAERRFIPSRHGGRTQRTTTRILDVELHRQRVRKLHAHGLKLVLGRGEVRHIQPAHVIQPRGNVTCIHTAAIRGFGCLRVQRRSRSRSRLLGEFRGGSIGIGTCGVIRLGRIGLGRIILVTGIRTGVLTVGVCRSFGLGGGLLGIGRRLVIGHGGRAHAGDAAKHRYGGHDGH